MRNFTLKLVLALQLCMMGFCYNGNCQTPEDYYNKVLKLHGSENDEQVLELLNKIIDIDSTFTRAYSTRGGIKDSMGDLYGAEDDCTKAIVLEPLNTNNFFARGSLRIYIGNLDGALSDLNRAIELDSTNFSAYNARGFARELLEDWHGVIEDRTVLIDAFPIEKFPNMDGSDYSLRGMAKYRINDVEGACSDWNFAAYLGFRDFIESQKAQKMIKKHCVQ